VFGIEFLLFDRCAASCCAGSTATPRTWGCLGWMGAGCIVHVMAVAAAARRMRLRSWDGLVPFPPLPRRRRERGKLHVGEREERALFRVRAHSALGSLGWWGSGRSEGALFGADRVLCIEDEIRGCPI